MVAKNAGLPATPADLIDVDEVVGAYYDVVPDPSVPEQRVIFGTSGHRGSSLKTSFNEAHIVAISQAIAEYRKAAGVDGPLYIGRDTHALSLPAWKTAIEVLVANGVTVCIDSRDDFTPTPVVSQAILTHNRAADGTQRFEGPGLADGIVVTPSHNPPTDGGFKYDPVTGGPAPADVTNAIANRANELLGDFRNVKRVPFEQAVKSEFVKRFDYREHYVDDLKNVIDFDVIRDSGVRLGIDPLGGASVNYWPLINEKYGLNIGVIRPEVDPTWRFMTIDHDGKIRMDPSSQYAMKGLVDALNAGAWDKYDLVGGTDPDADRHGIVCPNWGVMNPNHYLAVCVEYLFGGNARPGQKGSAAKAAFCLGFRRPAALGHRVSSCVLYRVSPAQPRAQVSNTNMIFVQKARPLMPAYLVSIQNTSRSTSAALTSCSCRWMGLPRSYSVASKAGHTSAEQISPAQPLAPSLLSISTTNTPV